jgi:cellulose synthase/poly-beta-1,6-N-acetylglucosamine synthase-like glycosyltransferase
MYNAHMTAIILFDIFRYGFGIVFVALHIAVMTGVILEWRRDKNALKKNNKNKNSHSHVSVIIPIHNESKRIEGLLRTLLIQNYPAEIIFIDDCSTDESPAMLAKFADDAVQRGFNCRIITLSENPGPNRKQYALARGIEDAKGDYYLLTDGDCEVPSNWIYSMAARIQDENTGAVIGPVFKKKPEKGFFFLYQCYDHAIRYYYLLGSTGLGAAGGGFGNNLIVNKKALDSVGGYDSIPPSPTEDAALISQIRRGGKFRIRAVSLPDAVVETESEKTWRTFINQTLRWNNGGLFSPEALTRFNYNLLMIIISVGILAIPVLPFFHALWSLSAAVLISMIINNSTLFALFRTKLPQGGFLIKTAYILFLVFTPAYFTLLTILGYARVKTTWKNETLN